MSGTFAADIPDFTNQVIDDGRLRLVEAIGEGAMGVVYRAVDESSVGSSSSGMKEYAVKVLVKADAYTVQGQCQSREIVMHQIASEHPSVLTLHKVIEEDRFIFLVVDYCPGGDLFNVIVERRSFCHNDYLVKKVFIQILDAVQSIHEKGIYHRDLKPDNIFVNADGTEVFLGDFGLATDVDECVQFGCGSSYYMSPECIGEEYSFIPYSPEKNDIWALGIILTNMIAGRNPWAFATSSDGNFLRHLAESDFLSKMLPISKQAEALLCRAFTFNPYSRISLKEFREEVMAIDTFFLTEKELVFASKHAREVAASYAAPVPAYTPLDKPPPRESVVIEHAIPPMVSDEDYFFDRPRPDRISLVPIPRIVLTSESVFTIGSASTDTDEDISSLSSSSTLESNSPLTPETNPADGKGLVSDLSLEADIGEAVCPVTLKKARSVDNITEESIQIVTA